ncbi:ABC transporter ATP-binding protein [Aminicella lysinilytica]|uniref:ATP-binding cassette subfamily B protein n=1 Tax=Aminicella lysinilytica TaxID=433323 RepID=A0A4R6Q8J9_9FIRM|nr:ABC transporter ATP-binding protein [Aminicella lysinilytica]TDP58455.1 ATP-binding cassette subfamily B protein [Aminicella lysinilytica]
MKRDFKNMNMLQVFVSYFKPHKKLFLLDMTCALAISLIDLAFPYISRWCMYTLLPGKLWKTFWIVMAIVFVAYLFRSYFTYIIAYWGHTFGIRVEADIRRDLFGHIQKLGFDYFDNNRTGQLMSRLTADLFDITELAHHGPEDVFISAVTIVGSLVIMFSIQWRLAIVIALMLPVFMLVVWRCRRSMSEASLKLKQTTAEINADIESGLSGIKTAKAFANESREFKKFNKSNDTFKTSKRQFHKAMGRFNAVMEFFMCILSVAVIAVGGALIMKGQLNIIDLITFSLYVTTFVTPVRKLSNFAELFANGTAGLHRFIELMKTEPDLVDAEDAEDLTDVRGDIDVDHVSFAYTGDHDVLNDVTLHIREGETLALVGSSGGGKTTLSQLIPRFYDVTDGTVYIDGKDVRSVTQESLHRNIGVVQQDVFLFADSIAENIRYGRLDATEDEIVEAAKMAEIYDDIMDMPDGFDTNAGERGQLLSGGQKQRISIARIFLKNPPVLILDEATSALDSVTEAKIQETFDQLSVGRTTIVIAHRLSTVRNADRIAVIEHGEIIELGTHDELVEKNGVYAELEKTQELK